jgi:hypothetical protein
VLEDSQMRPLLESDFLLNSILGSNFFFVSKVSKKKILLARAGDLCTTDLSERYLSKINEQFQKQQQEDLIFQAKLSEILSDLITGRDKEVEFLKLCKIIQQYYWNESQDSSLLDLCKVMKKTFCKIDDEIVLNIFQNDVRVFNRSFRFAALSVLLCLVNKVFDRELLYDIYTISFLYDYENLLNGIEHNTLDHIEDCRRARRPYISPVGRGYGASSLTFEETFRVYSPSFIRRQRRFAINPKSLDKVNAWHFKFEVILNLVDQVLSYERWIFTRGDSSGILKNLFQNENDKFLWELSSLREVRDKMEISHL